jgi:hypothetical protein
MSGTNDNRPATESGQGQSPPYIKGGVSRQSHVEISKHPLDHEGVVKIALSQSASDALAAIGPHCLIIASMADSTAPEHAQGRMILHCLPLAQELANDAFRVATGRARTVKIRPR